MDKPPTYSLGPYPTIVQVGTILGEPLMVSLTGHTPEERERKYLEIKEMLRILNNGDIY